MHKEKLEELIQLDLDGRATPEERLAIAEALERDPEARTIHAEIREVHQILDRRPKVDPPEDLRRRIATDVHRLSPRPVTAPVSELASAPRRHKRVMQFTLAAAALLVLAVLLVPALVHETDPNQMQGTMAASSDAEREGEGAVLLAGSGIEGVVLTAWEGNELVLRPELRSEGPGRLEVGFDPGQLQVVSAGGSADRPKGESGLVTATLDSNPSEIRFLRRSGDPVSLSLTLSKGGATTSTEIQFEASTNFSPGRL